MKKILYILFIMVISAIAVSCGNTGTDNPAQKTDTIPMLITQIQKCSRLYTAEYQVHKIITHDDRLRIKGSFMKKDYSIDLPAGNRKVAIPMDATIKAYIDFGNFNETNVKRQNGNIEIILPDPRITITSTRIAHEDIKQYVALMRSNFTDEELSNYEQQGRQAIVNDIPTMGITELAQESAANTLIPIIKQMGYDEKNITISFRKKFTTTEYGKFLDKHTVEHGK